MVNSGEATVDELVKGIEKFSALSEADILGVIVALENVIQDKLADGKIVRLEKLGSLYPSLSSEGVEKQDELTSLKIKEVTINYRPGVRLKNAINEAQRIKVEA
ncbi:MAG: HU family DNA-binding protein [Marinilabiliaceae bacterium]|nr:HU family DNA-binding protein [Marinilabiliaceae bacterium]